MAKHLASIFGTEKDKVNCPFYLKTGTCRHGERCSRLHNRPTISPTLLLSNMYHRSLDFEELSKFGELQSLNVCDNLGDHMIGNVYAQFRDEDQAAKALLALQGRFYFGRPIIVEFCPVTDFRVAICRECEVSSRNRGGYCNFVHVKMVGRELRRKLFGRYERIDSRRRSLSPCERDHRDGGGRKRHENPRGRSRSPTRDRRIA